MKRYDRRNNAQNRSIEDYYWGQQMIDARANEDAVEEDLIAREAPGYTRKTVTFWRSAYRSYGYGHTWVGPDPDDVRWADTPEEAGLPKWNGTPEENARMLRTVLRVYGSAFIGFDEIDTEHWRNKLIITHPTQRYSWGIVYEDVDQGYETETKHVLPSKQMYGFIAGAPEALFNIKTAPSFFSAGNRFGNFFMPSIYLSTWQFLRRMGFQMLSDWGHQSAPVNEVGASILAGLGEASRQNLYLLTPNAGTRINMQTAFTDMPLAPTHPIDAGMWKFCQTCGKCADTCPGGWISSAKEPTWEPDPENGKSTADMTHVVGPKSYWLAAAGCRMQRKLMGGSCHICYAECVFNEKREAMVHEIVKTTVATVPLFNGFFAQMSDFFGYGRAEDKEGWWDENLPIHGCESEIFARYRG
jgi:reductive dehalogenase